MKKKFQLCILSILIAIPVFSQDFYDTKSINIIKLTFNTTKWDSILTNNHDSGSTERLLASAIINGVQYDSVGVKYKGNSSYKQAINSKKPLNIKLDYVKQNQDIDGYGTLKLSNIFKDPSFVREVLGYEIASKYNPVSKANYAFVYINDTLIGLYGNVQSVDKLFLRNHFYGDEGAFFKGEIIRDFNAQGCPPGPPRVWAYLGPDTTCYERSYEIESDYGWQELTYFLNIFNNVTSQVENVLNVDRLLWMMAFDNLLVSLDAPINVAHNFYMYKDGNGRFSPILWDLNMTFGSFTRIGGFQMPPATITELQQLDPFLNISSIDFPMISKILPNTTYRKMYIAHMRTILNENFVNGLYLSRATELQNLIDSFVMADYNKFYTYNDFKNNLNNPVAGVVGIGQLMAGRLTYLQSMQDFQNIPPAINNISHNPTNVNPNSSITITAKIVDANMVFLGYRHSLTRKFYKIPMFDDGNHNDGVANDDIYGVEILVETSDLQYYIYAENADAGIFSPARAENEFHSIAVVGDVVINEFMASNTTVQADQDGEYDDWIELYNNSSASISLKDHYITDDANQLKRWAFPDTSINSKDYLIIWADGDTNQSGLHTGFKLSKAGESILLVDPQGAILDEITFGIQAEDLSTGRYPNGVGVFVEMPPTFSSENQKFLAIAEFSYNNVIKVYPNPSSTTVNIELIGYEEVELAIFNIMGKLIAQDIVKVQKQLDVSGWGRGIYFLRFSNNSTFKLIVN